MTTIVIALAVVLMATTPRSICRGNDPSLATFAAVASPSADRAAFHDVLLNPGRSASPGRGSRP